MYNIYCKKSSILVKICIKGQQTVQNMGYKYGVFVQKVENHFSLDKEKEKCYNKP